MLASLAQPQIRKDLSPEVRSERSINNREVVNAMSRIRSIDQVQYRKRERPWEIVPKYVRKRVTDLIGILRSEHRMEMEQVIDKLRGICDVDMYVVLVPTVGFVSTRCFAQSIFFDWEIGEPNGNGVLLVIAQHEATVHLCSSPAIQEYFDKNFLDLLVKEVMQPLVRQGDASYAVLQTTYAVARHCHEFRHHWNNSIVPLPMKNKLRFAEQTLYYGMFRTWSFYWVLFLSFMTGVFWAKILDAVCPTCGTTMAKVTDEKLFYKALSKGQSIEQKRDCARYKVLKCQKCEHEKVMLIMRDFFHSNKCLKCSKCGFFTCRSDKKIQRLATKTEDGFQSIHYWCENCDFDRDVILPLYHPIEQNPVEWYDFLIRRSHDVKA